MPVMHTTDELIHPTAEIDPSAIIDPTARIGAGAIIEAGVIVGPHCVIGARTRLRARTIIVEHTTLGEGNDVHYFTVIGGDPQDRAMDPNKRNAVIIGDNNIIREHVTIHRGTGDGVPTRIGSGCMFMASSHVGHNCQVGDRVVMANGCMLAGHVRMGNGCVLGGNVAIHQFVNVGDGVMFQGQSASSMHVPPFTIITEISRLAGLNIIGMRRNPAFSPKDREEIKELFRAVFRDRGGHSLEQTVLDLLQRPWGDAGTNFLNFLRDSVAEAPPRKRGICGLRTRTPVTAAE